MPGTQAPPSAMIAAIIFPAAPRSPILSFKVLLIDCLFSLSSSKVVSYAKRWLAVKIQVEEERERILNTLKECQREEHTKLLLSTPLQATIMLLLIEEGGHPPAQRAAAGGALRSAVRSPAAAARGGSRRHEAPAFRRRVRSWRARARRRRPSLGEPAIAAALPGCFAA